MVYAIGLGIPLEHMFRVLDVADRAYLLGKVDNTMDLHDNSDSYQLDIESLRQEAESKRHLWPKQEDVS